MPTYEAKCPKCDHVEEYVAPITDIEANKPICDVCNVPMFRIFPRTIDGGFILKGGGWYRDGYGNKQKKDS